jgi:hypothetical protein
MKPKEKFQAFQNKVLRKYVGHKKHEPMQTIIESPSTPSVACEVSQEGHTELEKLFGWSKYSKSRRILVGRSVG